jgi:hypothetical protein
MLPAVLVVAVAAGVAAGCGSSSRETASTSASNTLQALWDRPGENVTVVPGDMDFGPGLVRYSFLVVGKNGAPVYRPTAAVSVANGLDGIPFQHTTARLEQIGVGAETEPGDVQALYVAKLRLPKPGTYWLVAEPRGAAVQALGQVDVKAKTESPAVGSPAPRSDTPKLGDAPIAMLTTRTPPDRDLLRWSVADSIAAHKPFVVVFATPKFCTSRTCGPVVDVVEEVSKDFPRVRFIHVEIYKDNDPQKGENRWVRQWRLPSEPWIFLVGADGRIKAKFEGSVSVAELRRAVQSTLAR